MRRYDEVVQVRTGPLGGDGDGTLEGPVQVLWRDRLWQVRGVVAHWLETVPWWDQPAVHGLLGVHGDESAQRGAADAAPAPEHTATTASVATLVAEREVWHVEAARGRLGSRGVLELVHDTATGRWRLTGCED